MHWDHRRFSFPLALALAAAACLTIPHRRAGAPHPPPRPVPAAASHAAASPAPLISAPTPPARAHVSPEIVLLRRGWLWRMPIKRSGEPAGPLRRIRRLRVTDAWSLVASPDGKWAAVRSWPQPPGDMSPLTLVETRPAGAVVDGQSWGRAGLLAGRAHAGDHPRGRRLPLPAGPGDGKGTGRSRPPDRQPLAARWPADIGQRLRL